MFENLGLHLRLCLLLTFHLNVPFTEGAKASLDIDHFYSDQHYIVFFFNGHQIVFKADYTHYQKKVLTKYSLSSILFATYTIHEFVYNYLSPLFTSKLKKELYRLQLKTCKEQILNRFFLNFFTHAFYKSLSQTMTKKLNVSKKLKQREQIYNDIDADNSLHNSVSIRVLLYTYIVRGLWTVGMKMLSIDSLMRSTLLLLMTGGKDPSTAYSHYSRTLVLVRGSSGDVEKRSSGYRSS